MIDRLCIGHGGDLSVPSGGTDRVSAIASHLADRGTDVTVVAPDPAGQPVRPLDGVTLETVAVSTDGLASQPRRAATVSRRARDVSRATGATLQFEHSTLAGVGTLRGCRDYVLDVHDLAFGSPLYGALPFGSLVQRVIGRVERRGVGRASHVVVVSERMKTVLTTKWDVAPSTVSVVPNGFFEDHVARFRTDEVVPGRVAFLGTLHPKVDVDALVDVARLPGVEELFVVGDGPGRAALAEASERVATLEHTGRLPDEEAFELVSTAAVAVNPQHPSTLQATSSPVKLAYYAALGVPTVTTAGPDLATELGAADAGLVVDPADDFAARVEDLLENGDRRGAMGENALSLAQSWTWTKRLDGLTDVYRAISA